MKIKFIGLFAGLSFLSGMFLLAEPHAAHEEVDTDIVNGFFIGISDCYGSTNSSPDRPLYFSIWTKGVSTWTTNKMLQPTNYSHVIVPIKPEYAFRAELLDTNGIAISKTTEGEKTGSKFFDYGINTAIIHATGVANPNSVRMAAMEKTDGERGSNLFTIRPNDLFEIEKSGNYTLKIWLQIIAFYKIGTNYTNVLIRFPALNYPIIKLPNTLTNALSK